MGGSGLRRWAECGKGREGKLTLRESFFVVLILFFCSRCIGNSDMKWLLMSGLDCVHCASECLLDMWYVSEFIVFMCKIYTRDLL